MITRWPGERLRSFDRFSKMMDEMFNSEEYRGVWAPVVDIRETPKELTFVAELPGMLEKDVEVELTGDILTIRGTREFSNEEKKDDYVRIERNYGSFQRSFTLDVPVKQEEILASFKNGLLTVTVPKAENRMARKIEVKGDGAK